MCCDSRRDTPGQRFPQPRWLIAAGWLLMSCAPQRTATVPAAVESTLDARVLRMVDLRQADTALLQEALQSTRSATRARAALAIGQVKVTARYATLRQLLVDADTAVAANAAYALGIAKDTASVSALARAVAGAPDVVAREAAWSLGEIGSASRLVLTVALGDGNAQPLVNSAAALRAAPVRAALLLAAARMQPLPVTTINPWLADGDVAVVRAAAYAIARPRAPGGVRGLLSVQKHADEETRQHVARGLARSAAGDSLATVARQALSALVADTSPRVRMNAARSLVSYGPVARGDVERALADADANVRVAASEGIQAVFLRDTAAWQRAWQRDTLFRVRQQLLTGARAAGVAVFANAESEWSRHPDWQHRVAALEVRAAAAGTDEERLALVRATVLDTNARVRASALQVIPVATPDSTVRAMVMPFIADADLGTRAAALRQLVRRAKAEDLAVGLRAFVAASNDADNDARTSALQLVRAAWTRDSARVDAATRQQMQTMTGLAKDSERQLVASVTPLSAWVGTPAKAPERPLSDYVKLVRQWSGPNARQPRAVIHTDHGDIVLELFGADAPLVVEQFVRLAKAGYYRNTTFHRVVPNFVVQDGDGSGSDVPTLREAYSRQRHERGAVGLATSGPDTGGSQYYLCHSSQPHLDGGYTVFARVVSGLEVMDRIVQGDRMIGIEIQ